MPPTYINSQRKKSVKGEQAVMQIYQDFTEHTRGMKENKKNNPAAEFLTDYALEAGLVKLTKK